MAKRSPRHASFIEPKHSDSRKAYSARYRSDHPLLQGRVPVRLYREAQRRAKAVDFSVSKWLGYWLELTFADHPLEDS